MATFSPAVHNQLVISSSIYDVAPLKPLFSKGLPTFRVKEGHFLLRIGRCAHAQRFQSAVVIDTAHRSARFVFFDEGD
jgi:hypothetical protein